MFPERLIAADIDRALNVYEPLPLSETRPDPRNWE